MRKHSTIDVTTLAHSKIKAITQLVFHAPPPKPSDIMLVFGAPEGDWSAVAKSFHQGLTQKIIVSGSTHERTRGRSEAALIKDFLVSRAVPETVIIEESKATNTLENVLLFKQIIQMQSTPINSVLYHCLNFHSGRCYLTLHKHFPQASLSATTHNVLYSGLDITPENWHTDQIKASRVLGEYERIMNYSQKGDISPPEVILLKDH